MNDDESIATAVTQEWQRKLDKKIQAHASQAINNNTSVFKPIDWDKMVIKADDLMSHSITGINANTVITASLPGNLLEYTMEYDMDELKMSGLPEDQQEAIFKKELAAKLVEKMIADGHIVFTKQSFMAEWKMRFKAYTWVGNKSFIEQQRKNKRP